jgi:fucose-1-phosphate guanylyltransferase
MKKRRQEVPLFVEYIVISDPPGLKVGSGGSTLHSLENLLTTIGPDDLSKRKVMMIHAGGYSQRLPNQSILGKVLLTLPSRTFPMQMLDALFLMYIDIPEKMNPGVFVAASDVIFLFNGEGEWDFEGPGFTAIAHPASVNLAKNHGVFILKDMKGPWEGYKKDPSRPATSATPECFVHKQTADELYEKGAIIPETELVYVDLAYYFDVSTMSKLTEFYAGVKPITCEIDAYGDFLQPLGSAASGNYFRDSPFNQSNVQEQLYHILKGTPLTVVIFHEAQFNHLGTVAEFIYHMCGNIVLRDALQFNIQTPSKGNPGTEKAECSSVEGYAVMHSIVYGDRWNIGTNTVIEYCHIERGVFIGNRCLLSYLSIPEGTIIPDNTFMHTMAMEMDHKILYATCIFGVEDDLKKVLPRRCGSELEILHVSLGSASGMVDSAVDVIWPQKTHCNLWTARLFPACLSRKESCEAAISIMKAIQERCLLSVLRLHSKVVSMEDAIMWKSTSSMLDFQSELLRKNES